MGELIIVVKIMFIWLTTVKAFLEDAGTNFRQATEESSVSAPSDQSETVTESLPLTTTALDLPVYKVAPREHEVLQLLARGLPYKIIAGEMGIALGTLFTYIRRIYRKLGVNNRTEAVLKYFKQ